MFDSDFEKGRYHPLILPEYNVPLTIDGLREIFSSCSDFEVREIAFGLEKNVRLNVCWLDGIVSAARCHQACCAP